MDIDHFNAWSKLGETWHIVGIVPGWAEEQVYICPGCGGPAVATEVYIGGRGDVPRLECANGHITDREGITTPLRHLEGSEMQLKVEVLK